MRRLGQFFLGVVVNEVDSTGISDDALGFDPYILDSWVVNFVNSFIQLEFQRLEVVSGENGLFVSHFEENSVEGPWNERSFSE